MHAKIIYVIMIKTVFVKMNKLDINLFY